MSRIKSGMDKDVIIHQLTVLQDFIDENWDELKVGQVTRFHEAIKTLWVMVDRRNAKRRRADEQLS